MTDRDSTTSGPEPPEDLQRLARSFARPDLTEPALDEVFGPRSGWEVLRGQLWRASVDDLAMLVLVLDVDGMFVEVSPVTVEASSKGQGRWVLDEQYSPLRCTTTVWLSLRSQVPLCVLQRPVGTVDESLIPLPPLAPVKAGHATLADRMTEARIEDDLDVLARTAETLPLPAEGSHSPPPSTPSEEQLDALVAGLSLPLRRVLAMLDGNLEVTPDQQGVFIEVLGQAPGRAELPRELLVEATHPRNREFIPEPSTKLTGGTSGFEVAARGAYALAARQTGPSDLDGEQEGWARRLREWSRAQRPPKGGAHDS